MDWSGALQAVRTKQADVVAGIMRTPDAEAWLDFPHVAIETYFHVFFHKTLHAFKDLDSLDDSVAIGVVKDDYPEGVLRQRYPNRVIKTYPDHDALISAAIRKEILVFVLEPEVAEYYFALKNAVPPDYKEAAQPFAREVLYAGIGKGRPAESYWIQAGFSQISPKEISEILKEWNYNTTESQLHLIAIELKSHPIALTVASIFIGYWFCILFLIVLSSLFPLLAIATERYMRDILAISITFSGVNLKFSVHGLFLLEAICLRRKILRAWLNSKKATVTGNFLRLDPVRERLIYSPLPLTIDGTVMTDDDPAMLEQHIKKALLVLRDQDIPLLIFGEGGAGKTALAILFANWYCGFDQNPSDSDSLLPIFIEEEFTYDDNSSDSAFRNAIHGALENLANDNIDEVLFSYLLKYRVLCVVLDGVSEMSLRTRSAIGIRKPSFPRLKLIMTSRDPDEECLAGTPFTRISQTRFGGVHISTFANRYMTATKCRDRFSDSEFYRVCMQLAVITGGRDITPLFARLFLDLTIFKKVGGAGTDGDLTNICELVESYVVGLNERIREDRLSDRTVLQTAKLLSWAEMSPEYMPRTMTRKEIDHVLGSDFNDLISHYFSEKLVFLRRIDRSGDRVKVVFDPIAEHLAALYSVEQYLDGHKEELLKVVRFFERLDQKGFEKRAGMLSALSNVWTDKNIELDESEAKVRKALDKVFDFVRSLERQDSTQSQPEEQASPSGA